jgi:hypothetical protein
MHRKLDTLVIPAILTLAAGLAGSAVQAQTVVQGQTDSGAYHTFMVPDGWQPQDGLVIWNHGFSLNPVGPVSDLGPLVALQLSEGYAVAASSYSQSGWALFQATDDLDQMYEDFVSHFGAPLHTWVTGASLGGLVTIQAIETASLGNVVGAMPICAPAAGSRVWNAGLDLRLLYDAVCGEVPGAAIPGGAMGLGFPPDPSFDSTAMATAVHACTGILAPPEARTPEQEDRLNTLLDIGEIPENFLLTDMGYVTFGLADLSYAPDKLAGAHALGNSDVDYGAAAINASIERVEADQAAAQHLLDNYTPTGQVGNTKIVSIHTSGDGLVFVENMDEYAQIVPPHNLTVGIVNEATPSHCGFTAAETAATWESLRGWVAGLPQPDAATLQATCQGIEGGGLAAGPCRIDPTYINRDLDIRVRPRASCDESTTTICLKDRFEVAADWRDFEGHTGQARVSSARTAESGSFYFFDPENLELTVKVIDGRGYNGNFWYFFGALTNVEFNMTVTDTDTGQIRLYQNALGEFGSEGDTSAF